VSGPSSSGGTGIYISAGSALTISNNKITGNTNYVAGLGGGVYITSSTPLILNNVITNNSPGTFGEGAGIYVSSASPLIKGNNIISNISYGSGIYVTGSSSSPRILNNVIAKNKEGGIECVGSSKARIINNTISDNTLDGILISSAAPDSIINNIISLNSNYGINESGTTSDPGKGWYNLFYSNGAGVYRDEGSTDYYTSATMNSGVAECKNNLDGDPMFVDNVNGDYHLRSGSPAINAGDPGSPLDPDGTRADIGAFYYAQAASVPSLPSLSSPSDGASSQPTTLSLSWGTSAAATKYHLQVSTSSAFTTVVVDDSSLTGTSKSVGPLANGATHYWRVRAADICGNLNEGS
ncbi:MAG: right-handed parallel beta-helix repeat-containing protein, partial [Bacteroidota bacterium]